MRGKRGEKTVVRAGRKNTPRISTLFLIGCERMVAAGKFELLFCPDTGHQAVR
jgi:hypothetical protein